MSLYFVLNYLETISLVHFGYLRLEQTVGRRNLWVRNCNIPAIASGGKSGVLVPSADCDSMEDLTFCDPSWQKKWEQM